MEYFFFLGAPNNEEVARSLSLAFHILHSLYGRPHSRAIYITSTLILGIIIDTIATFRKCVNSCGPSYESFTHNIFSPEDASFHCHESSNQALHLSESEADLFGGEVRVRLGITGNTVTGNSNTRAVLE